MSKRIKTKEMLNILAFRSAMIFSFDMYIDEINKGNFDYLEELHTIDNLLDFEEGTFAIISDEITDRIYDVINTKRWEMMKTSPEVNNYINNIIMKLNVLDRMSEEDKDFKREDYLTYIEDVKDIEFDNYFEYLKSFSMDIITFNILNGEKINNGLDLTLLIGSINYLMKIMPTMLKIGRIKNRLNEVAEEIKGLTDKPTIIYGANEIQKKLTKEYCLNTKKMIY